MAWYDWEHLSSDDLPATAADAVAVLPVAAIEQHGPHLPLGTDAILTDAVVDAARRRGTGRAEVYRLPTQRIGLSPEHLSFPGTLSLPATVVIDHWIAIGEGVKRAGIAKLLILNGHGGQSGIVDVVATALRRTQAMTVARVTTFRLIDGGPGDTDPPARDLSQTERRYGLHGGMLETSLMLAVAPELVRSDRVERFVSAAESVERRHPALEVEGRIGLAWMAEDLHPGGVTGDAGGASAELGHRLLERMAARLAAIIDDLAAFDGFGTPQ